MSKDDFHILQDRSAGFVSRLLAYIIDVVLIAAVVAVGGAIAALMDRALDAMGANLRVEMTLIYVWSIPLIIGAYYIMFWSLTGRTVGKWFMGLKVIGPNGQPPSIGRSTLRFLGYGLSAIAFWVGYVWVVIDEERQAWHDHMAKTWVVYDYSRRKSGEIYDDYRDRVERPS
jgi:uncharacterized RDD family membrane protein YckC